MSEPQASAKQEYPATAEGDYRRAADEIRAQLDKPDGTEHITSKIRRQLARALADMAIRWTAAQHGAAVPPADQTDSDERE